ncbi:MAG: beta-phosphoglucomutase [Bacteroidota bacterium]
MTKSTITTPYDAFIFDLDGVIVDTAKYHFLAWKRLAGELGITLEDSDEESLKGVSRLESLDIILSKGTVEIDDAEKEALATKKNNWYLEYIEGVDSSDLLPGTGEFLKELKDQGLKIGLASSSKNAKPVLNKLNITEYFDVIIDGTMIKNTKPDPEIFNLCAELLCTAKDRCIVFEDAVSGVEASKAAGIDTIGIGEPEVLNKADLVVSSLADINLKKISTFAAPKSA